MTTYEPDYVKYDEEEFEKDPTGYYQPDNTKHLEGVKMVAPITEPLFAVTPEGLTGVTVGRRERVYLDEGDVGVFRHDGTLIWQGSKEEYDETFQDAGEEYVRAWMKGMDRLGFLGIPEEDVEESAPETVEAEVEEPEETEEEESTEETVVVEEEGEEVTETSSTYKKYL